MYGISLATISQQSLMVSIHVRICFRFALAVVPAASFYPIVTSPVETTDPLPYVSHPHPIVKIANVTAIAACCCTLAINIVI